MANLGLEPASPDCQPVPSPQEHACLSADFVSGLMNIFPPDFSW